MKMKRFWKKVITHVITIAMLVSVFSTVDMGWNVMEVQAEDLVRNIITNDFQLTGGQYYENSISSYDNMGDRGTATLTAMEPTDTDHTPSFREGGGQGGGWDELKVQFMNKIKVEVNPPSGYTIKNIEVIWMGVVIPNILA